MSNQQVRAVFHPIERTESQAENRLPNLRRGSFHKARPMSASSFHNPIVRLQSNNRTIAEEVLSSKKKSIAQLNPKRTKNERSVAYISSLCPERRNPLNGCREPRRSGRNRLWRL